MDETFGFEDAGRTYACHVEKARTPHMAPWWWFTVTGDAQRYAPFHADAGDTEDAVRSRIVSYYETLLARRRAPREPWGGRRDKTAVAAPASVPAPGSSA
jgi:hypothetical protein